MQSNPVRYLKPSRSQQVCDKMDEVFAQLRLVKSL
jgi:hypothetical protein